jgi:hypothetical protein
MRFFLAALLVVLASVVAAGCSRIGSCEAADVHGLATGCSGPSGFVWNGSSCIQTQKCGCTGDDCQSFYDDVDACEAAHAHCR